MRRPGAPHPDENVAVLCDINQNRARLRVAALPAGQEVHRPPARLRSPERLRRRRGVHGGAHARVCHLPGADARQARLLREAARLQHLGNAPHPRDRREVSEAVHADGQPGPRLAARGARIKEILNTGVIGPVREVHVWADRAWGLQDAASAEKFDKPHGFYNGIQIVDRFKEEMPIPSHHSTGICGSARAGAAVPCDVFPGPAVVSLVGFRQRHDERPRQPRQRRAVHRARSLAAATIESGHVAQSSSRFAQRAELAPATMAGRYRVPGVGRRGAAGAQAGLAPGRQQTAGLGAGVGRPLARVHRRKRHAARQREAAARGEIQGLPDAARDAAALARPLGGVGQLRQGQRSRARARTSSIPAGRPKRTTSATSPTGPGRRSSGTTRTCAPATRRKPRRSSSGPSIAKAGTTS